MADPSLTSSDSAAPVENAPERRVGFVCNICGLENQTPESQFGREVPSCDGCGSTVRTRAVAQMIARELFGLDLALPAFPVLKGIRGIGISDSPDYAGALAAKFSYQNTFYHKGPKFDILNVPESEWGTYDFLIASEVFEHVAPPVEVAFRNAFRLLKPNGLFFFTVPYTLAERTTEHFPELHEYGIAELGDRHVLVNRTREGRVEVFENLVFHGGGGETLELRVYTENDLRGYLTGAGFRSVEIYARNYAPFGILRPENWSLPMTARKAPFALELDCTSEVIGQALDREKLLRARIAECEQWMAQARLIMATQAAEVESRTQWAQDRDAQLKERTEWALHLERDVTHHLELAQQFQKEAQERSEWALRLQADLDALEARLARIEGSPWTRAGRLLKLVRG